MSTLLTLISLVCAAAGKLHLQQKFSIPDGEIFGHSVSLSETFAVVGADDDSTFSSYNGAAYIYHHDQLRDTWNQTQKIFSSNPTESGSFGYSVAIFENNIIVGESGSNKAHIYKLNETNNNNTFYHLTTLTSLSSDSEKFGQSVDITDGYAIVGDCWYDDFCGISYIFIQNINEETGTETWVKHQTLTPSGCTQRDFFAGSVSISYNYAIVGAIENHYSGDLEAGGSAYIYELNQNTMQFEQVSKITFFFASDVSSSDWFGFAVSIDFVSGFAIIGSNYVGDDNAGASYIFQRDNITGNWNEMEKLTPTRSDTRYFGSSVFIHHKMCIVCGYGSDDGTQDANVYELSTDSNSNTWELIADERFAGGIDYYFQQTVSIFNDFAIIAGAENSTVYFFGGLEPSLAPTIAPTVAPIISPTNSPAQPPTISPSLAPTTVPTLSPSLPPTTVPTKAPSVTTLHPSEFPTHVPSSEPTPPSSLPSRNPTHLPTKTSQPSLQPSFQPSFKSTITTSLAIISDTPTLGKLGNNNNGDDLSIILNVVLCVCAILLCVCVICVYMYHKNGKRININININKKIFEFGSSDIDGETIGVNNNSNNDWKKEAIVVAESEIVTPRSYEDDLDIAEKHLELLVQGSNKNKDDYDKALNMAMQVDKGSTAKYSTNSNVDGEREDVKININGNVNGEGDINDGLSEQRNSVNVQFEGEIRTGVNAVDIDRALGFDIGGDHDNKDGNVKGNPNGNDGANIAQAGQVGQVAVQPGAIDDVVIANGGGGADDDNKHDDKIEVVSQYVMANVNFDKMNINQVVEDGQAIEHAVMEDILGHIQTEKD